MGRSPNMFSLSRLNAGNFACGETARTNRYGAKPHFRYARSTLFFSFPLHILFFEKSEAIFQTIHHFLNKLWRTYSVRHFLLFHRHFLDSEHCSQQTGKQLWTFQNNDFHYVRSFHSFSRKIPITISRIATANSRTLSEKKEMHIIAPKKARIARATPIPQRFFRFLGLLIAVTSSSAFP